MTATAWEVAGAVPDPEIPMLTIADLGILREVGEGPDGRLRVRITPTYSGCPAMEAIRDDVLAALERAGYRDAVVEVVIAPAWTTDWMSQGARRTLEEHGIAPPEPVRPDGPVPLPLTVRCPQCGSPDTRELSRFGSTACKALWVCRSCREPFDRFKAL